MGIYIVLRREPYETQILELFKSREEANKYRDFILKGRKEGHPDRFVVEKYSISESAEDTDYWKSYWSEGPIEGLVKKSPRPKVSKKKSGRKYE